MPLMLLYPRPRSTLTPAEVAHDVRITVLERSAIVVAIDPVLLAIARAATGEGNLCSQTSIDCWAKIPAIAPCDDARVTEGMRGGGEVAGGVDAGHAGFAALVDLEGDAEGRIDRGEGQ